MSSLLENKVSNLMAEVKELNKKIKSLNIENEEKEQQKIELGKDINLLDDRIRH